MAPARAKEAAPAESAVGPLAITLLLSVVIGAAAALLALPVWSPSLGDSLLGSEPKAYWYLSRSSGLVAYGLLWLSMLFGLLITTRMARLWPGGPTAFDLHEHSSLLALAFALFHALILLGDRYIQASLGQILIPFRYSGFEPVAVGIGQLSLYGLAVVGLSFYVKGQIGRARWRLIHFLSFALFLTALLHGVWSGTDSANRAILGMYWLSGGSVLFLTIYRLLAARLATRKTAAKPARQTAK